MDREWIEKEVEESDGTKWLIRVSHNLVDESKNKYEWMGKMYQTIERINITPYKKEPKYTYILYVKKVDTIKLIEPLYMGERIFKTNQPLTDEELAWMEESTGMKVTAEKEVI